MRFSKLIALIICASLCILSLTACVEKKADEKVEDTTAAEELTDLQKITKSGKLRVGITVYPPMNYLDENGEWTGFDTEFARIVAEELGLEIEFVVIEWGSKWDQLQQKNIDCVWNGMTLSSEAEANASCTNTYIRNSQVVVTSLENKDIFTNAAALKDAVVAVEEQSAGMSAAMAANLNYTEYPLQDEALTALLAGKADACIIDITMARTMVGEGTENEDLCIAFPLTKEEYAIACRQGSDLTEKINEIMEKLISDGTLRRLADKYELTLTADLNKSKPPVQPVVCSTPKRG